MGVRRYRFVTLGKSSPAHRAGAPTAPERWVSLITTAALSVLDLLMRKLVKISNSKTDTSKGNLIWWCVDLLLWWSDSPTARERWAGVNFPAGVNLAHSSWPYIAGISIAVTVTAGISNSRALNRPLAALWRPPGLGYQICPTCHTIWYSSN